MADPILYRDANDTVVLIDIPTSIEYAQQNHLILASVPPPEVPYSSTEPRGNKRAVALARIPAQERTYHSSVQCLIQESLAKIKTSYIIQVIDGQSCSWHRPRRYLTGGDATTDSGFGAARALPDEFRSVTDGSLVHPILVPVILSSTELRNEFPSLRAVQDVIVRNPRPDSSLMCLQGAGGFWVPPHSTCIQSSLEEGWEAFVNGIPVLQTPKCRSFDLILMDPPWINRSARRSGHYETAETQMTNPFNTAVQIVKTHLVPDGIVAVWITNRAAIRTTVLDTFRALNLELHQEWIWIKITADGEPVTQLDGIWRRPYEVCLLFRKGQCSDNKPRRRVLVAVPDIHSRKPNLKCLLEQQLPPRYEALELFARCLTAGWWSWGNEVLKFQHESQWGLPDTTDCPRSLEGRT
ncbi:uncharacterized protein A1O9_10906 [Exophiala aquamarina CBS 119918]|uniref:MT-A70-domain-containing protein n=1 Tax=Exophiala aquamarina CBS 119918 TaxID=1182545 RepID=A0A072P143_9EURO|nr:uncharacterized protein A1O9_10906 [Exophiala aquamarina CBS 119918]KEF52998.1 hypothetical protein A1O9_10906 [Exophiala aquamarina CBS 119918]